MASPVGKPTEGMYAQLLTAFQMMDKQLKTLRDEHEALLRCLERQGILQMQDIQMECDDVSKFVTRQGDLNELRNGSSIMSAQQKQSMLPKPNRAYRNRLSTSKTRELRAPPSEPTAAEIERADLYEVTQKLLDANADSSEQQKAMRMFSAMIKNPAEPPNTWNGPGFPLSAVVRAGRSDLTRILLRARANPNYRDAKGVCALHLAVFDGSLEQCKVLLMARAEPDACDRHGQTPLFFAPTKDICKVLVERRADVAILNRKGQSALHLAGRAGLHEVLEWFNGKISKNLFDLRDAHGSTAKQYLIQSGVPAPQPLASPRTTPRTHSQPRNRNLSPTLPAYNNNENYVFQRDAHCDNDGFDSSKATPSTIRTTSTGTPSPNKSQVQHFTLDCADSDGSGKEGKSFEDTFEAVGNHMDEPQPISDELLAKSKAGVATVLPTVVEDHLVCSASEDAASRSKSFGENSVDGDQVQVACDGRGRKSRIDTGGSSVKDDSELGVGNAISVGSTDGETARPETVETENAKLRALEEERSRAKALKEEQARERAAVAEAERAKALAQAEEKRRAEEREKARLQAEEEERLRERTRQEEIERARKQRAEQERIQAEEERRARLEEDERVRVQALEAAKRARAEEDARARDRAEEERIEAEKAEKEERIRQEDLQRVQAEEEARAREERRRKEEREFAQAEEEKRARATEDARAKARAEEEAREKIRAAEEEQARIRAEEEEKRAQAEEEGRARIRAEEEERDHVERKRIEDERVRIQAEREEQRRFEETEAKRALEFAEKEMAEARSEKGVVAVRTDSEPRTHRSSVARSSVQEIEDNPEFAAKELAEARSEEGAVSVRTDSEPHTHRSSVARSSAQEIEDNPEVAAKELAEARSEEGAVAVRTDSEPHTHRTSVARSSAQEIEDLRALGIEEDEDFLGGSPAEEDEDELEEEEEEEESERDDDDEGDKSRPQGQTNWDDMDECF